MIYSIHENARYASTRFSILLYFSRLLFDGSHGTLQEEPEISKSKLYVVNFYLGTVIDLRGREGNEVDLHGWSVAKSSQMERLTRRVAAYWRTIQDLQDSTDQLNNNLKMVTAKNKDTLKEVEVRQMILDLVLSIIHWSFFVILEAN